MAIYYGKKLVLGTSTPHFDSVSLTLAEYEAMKVAGTLDPTTYYVIKDDAGRLKIDDTTTSTASTWSSNKMKNMFVSSEQPIAVDTFADITPTGGFHHYVVMNPAGTSDPDAPVTDTIVKWWNVVTIGHKDRLNMFATCGFISRSYTDHVFMRTKHDSTWSAWRDVSEIPKATNTAYGGVKVIDVTLNPHGDGYYFYTVSDATAVLAATYLSETGVGSPLFVDGNKSVYNHGGVASARVRITYI